MNEYNALHSEYKRIKHINAKIKHELTQSNERERTFLKLLKKTSEFGEQASVLEKEYEKLFDENDIQLNYLDSDDKKQGKEAEIIEKCGVKMKKLDLSTINNQREAISTLNDGSNEDGGPEE